MGRDLRKIEETTGVQEEDVTVVRKVEGPAAVRPPRPERAELQRAVLVIAVDGQAPWRFCLEERDHVIGRASEVDINLVDDSISRQHAVLLFRRDDFVLKDLDSKNGTFLNGTAVHECPLRPGDVIRIGNHSLRFQLEAPHTTP